MKKELIHSEDNEVLDTLIQELLENDQALDAMIEAENAEALMQVFADNNIFLEDVTPEEAFDAFQRAKCGDLSEEDLENVNGGAYFMLKTLAFTVQVSGSVGAALTLVGGVALIGLATYAAYRYIKKRV